MARGKKIVEVHIDDVQKRKLPTKHYVYIITVTWSDGNVSVIYRRYSNFFEFQIKLLDRFPDEAGKTNPAERIIPFLPGKIIFGRSHVRDVALKRLEHINLYCKQLIQLPQKISEADQVINFFEPTHEDLVPPESRKDNKSDQIQAHMISEPVLLEQYQVVANYSKEGASEISLRAGELVDIVEKSETGWWFVSGEDGQGWVPSSYLDQGDDQEDDAIDSAGTDRPHLATQEYDPQFPDEIALEHGAVVEVLKKNLDGWWQVKSKGKQGLVPGNFLTRADTLRAKRIQGALDRQQVARTDRQAAESNTDSGGDAEDEVGSVSARSAGPRHMRPAPDPPKPRQKPAVPVDSQSPSLPKKQSQFASSAAQPKKPTHIQTRIDRHAKASAPSSSSGAGLSDESQLVYGKPPPPRRRSIKRLVSLHPPEEQETKPEEPVYMTAAAFTNHAGDGISFGKGATVQVIDKHVNGWWYVNIGGKEGWAPSEYIKKSAKETPAKKQDDKQNKPQNKVAEKPKVDQRNGSPKTTGGRAKPLPVVPPRTKTTEVPSDDDETYVNEVAKKPGPPPLPVKGNKPASKPTPANRNAPVTQKTSHSRGTDPTSRSSANSSPQPNKTTTNVVAELANNIRRKQAAANGEPSSGGKKADVVGLRHKFEQNW